MEPSDRYPNTPKEQSRDTKEHLEASRGHQGAFGSIRWTSLITLLGTWKYSMDILDNFTGHLETGTKEYSEALLGNRYQGASKSISFRSIRWTSLTILRGTWKQVPTKHQKHREDVYENTGTPKEHSQHRQKNPEGLQEHPGDFQGAPRSTPKPSEASKSSPETSTTRPQAPRRSPGTPRKQQETPKRPQEHPEAPHKHPERVHKHPEASRTRP